MREKLKQHLRQNWKYYISPTLLVCLLLAGLWYWRGVTFATVAENITPDAVNVYVACLDETGKHVSAHYEVEADTAGGMEILDSLYSLTIHRPPTNLLYQILKPTLSGVEMEEGDYVFVVRVFGKNGGHAALQCSVKNWSYDRSGQSNYLPCSVEDGIAAGREFGAQLWAIGEKLDCIG